MSFLCIDKGNTRIRLTVFEEDLPTLLAESREEEDIPLFINKFKVKAIGMSNVSNQHVSMPEKIEVIELNGKHGLPFVSKYTTPETLGADRIAAVLGGLHYFPSKAQIIIDAGTCITFDYVEPDGVHVGGAISPGIQMRLNAMHHFTGRLPQVKMQENFSGVMTNTEGCMLSGAEAGALAECEWRIQQWLQKWPNSEILITGGNGESLAKQLKYRIFAQPLLVPIGIWKRLKTHEF